MRPKPLPPFAGVADNTGALYLRPGFVPPASMRNVRITPKRLRVEQRAGWRKLFPTRLGASVQAVGVVSRGRGVVGYVPGECAAVEDWTSHGSGPIAGQMWLLDPDPSLRDDLFEDTTSTGGGATTTANTVAASPEGTHFAASLNYTDGVTGQEESRITYRTRDGAEVWQTTLQSASQGFAVNQLAISSGLVFAAIATSTDFMLRGFRRDNAAQVVVHNLNGWARQAIGIGVHRPSATEEYLYVAFTGANRGATLPSGVVVSPGTTAQHFRAGVMKFRINADHTLTQVPYGSPRLSAGATYFEADHRYARFSELTAGAPHGCLPTGLAVGPNGVALLHTNQGWGPNASFPPDGSGAPYTTVMMLDHQTGTVQWEVDTESIREDDGSGRFNDLGASGPSIWAGVFDAGGSLYVGGRRNSTDPATGASAFRLEPDGTLRWRKLLGPLVYEAAAAFDASDGAVLFGGQRNTAWSGAGTNAHLWKLNAGNGNVHWGWDLGKATPATGVAVLSEGRIVYSTDHVS